ncbi:cyanidin 3-O-glucoside 7-O-glucosyltransferase (acyl-glucose)-like [Thrips palmi]|uniref:Cyanidin 3-O-glucoside 7-O-glucosyltransferase (Acyl-glucose)-like n=1 Tax=Thrips palmi TaxID=161013 RepID=A0A6P8ZUL4_THRPL|nr:cyanidin 3-O-glucoside 7-O-glucosyltransferase (acyl-glucose)-like [Thrips palmi]
MGTSWALVACLVLCVGSAVSLPSLGTVGDEDEANYILPEGFLLGGGTSAVQTEGAWDEDGKGVNVFDAYYHSHNKSTDQTGDIAADSYHRYKEDIGIAADIGLNALRFSISWARIFKTGRKDSINPAGVQHYHDVIDEMRRKNIEPVVTIYHFDHPQALHEEFDGWLGEQMPAVFAEFADFLFAEYGSKVRGSMYDVGNRC